MFCPLSITTVYKGQQRRQVNRSLHFYSRLTYQVLLIGDGNQHIKIQIYKPCALTGQFRPFSFIRHLLLLIFSVQIQVTDKLKGGITCPCLFFGGGKKPHHTPTPNHSPRYLSTEIQPWMFYSGKASADSSVTCGSSAGVCMARLWQPDLFTSQLQLYIPALKKRDCLCHQQEQSQETQYTHYPKKHCSSETHFSLHFCLLWLGTVICCCLVLEELISFLAQNRLFCPKGGERKLRSLPCPLWSIATSLSC